MRLYHEYAEKSKFEHELKRIGCAQPFRVIGVEGFVQRQHHDILPWPLVIAIQ